jgi:hypothetical protein
MDVIPIQVFEVGIILASFKRFVKKMELDLENKA